MTGDPAKATVQGECSFVACALRKSRKGRLTAESQGQHTIFELGGQYSPKTLLDAYFNKSFAKLKLGIYYFRKSVSRFSENN